HRHPSIRPSLGCFGVIAYRTAPDDTAGRTCSTNAQIDFTVVIEPPEYLSGTRRRSAPNRPSTSDTADSAARRTGCGGGTRSWFASAFSVRTETVTVMLRNRAMAVVSAPPPVRYGLGIKADGATSTGAAELIAAASPNPSMDSAPARSESLPAA